MDIFVSPHDLKSIAVFSCILLWGLFWKGLALWQSAQRGQRSWFVILLVVSTFGILEIIYLFFVLKLKPAEVFERKTKETEEK